MILRYYQKEAIESVSPEPNKKDLIVLPQGAGKSVIITTLANKYADKGYKVAVTTDRVILLQQLKSHLKPNIILKSRSALANMAATFDILIIDEAHNVNVEHGQYAKIINSGSAYILGLTATPYRLDHGHIVPKIFQNVIYEVSRDTLVKEGYLCERKYAPIPPELMINVKPSEYNTLKSISSVAKCSTTNIINYVNDLQLEDKTIIFGTDIEHCEMIQKELNHNSYVVSSTQSQIINDGHIEAFKGDGYNVIISCMMLTVGFDAPCIRNVINLRPTTSWSLYEQLIGRGDRIFPNKKYNTVYDFTFNQLDFGKSRDYIIVCMECGQDTDTRLQSCKECGAKIYREQLPTPKDKVCACGVSNPSRGRFCKGCASYLVEPTVEYTTYDKIKLNIINGCAIVNFAHTHKGYRGIDMTIEETYKLLGWLGSTRTAANVAIQSRGVIMVDVLRYTAFSSTSFKGKLTLHRVINHQNKIIELKGVK